MKRSNRQILSLALSAMMLLSAFPATVYAQGGAPTAESVCTPDEACGCAEDADCSHVCGEDCCGSSIGQSDAENPAVSTITAIGTPADITATVGTAQEDLGLPGELGATATVQGETGPVEQTLTLPVDGWESTPAYDQATPGSYAFAPTLGALPFPLAEGVERPVLTVALEVGGNADETADTGYGSPDMDPAPQQQVAPVVLAGSYNATDVAAMNALIAAYPGIGLEPWDTGEEPPDSWNAQGTPEGDTVVTWNDATPGRIVGLHLFNKDIQGTMDVSGLTALESLSISDSPGLTGLTVAAPALKTLLCTGNALTSLDVSGSTSITRLACNENQLSALDLSLLTGLEELFCQENQLTTLDLSAQSALKTLYCYDNRLSALNLSASNSLTSFDGTGQNISFTLSGAGNYESGFTSPATLAGPTFTNTAISYSGVTLKSTDKSVISTGFTVETGKTDMVLSGTLSLIYENAAPYIWQPTGDFMTRYSKSNTVITLQSDTAGTVYHLSSSTERPDITGSDMNTSSQIGTITAGQLTEMTIDAGTNEHHYIMVKDASNRTSNVLYYFVPNYPTSMRFIKTDAYERGQMDGLDFSMTTNKDYFFPNSGNAVGDEARLYVDGVLLERNKDFTVANTVSTSVQLRLVAAYLNTLAFGSHTMEIRSLNGLVVRVQFTTEVPDRYTITLTTDGEGTVQGGGNYDAGTPHTITATPATGWQFVGWRYPNNSYYSYEANHSFTVNKNLTLVAVFTPSKYTVTLIAQPGTSGRVNPARKEYVYGATATATATPNRYYHFVNWTENGVAVSTDAVYSFTVTGDRQLAANFEIATYNLRYHGLDAGMTNPNPTSYTYGETIQLQPPSPAKNSEGLQFAGWFDQETGGRQLFVIISGDRDLWARWEDQRPTRKITYEGLLGSSAEGWPDSYVVGEGIRRLPQPRDGLVDGFTFVEWRRDGIDGEAMPAIGSMATSDMTLYAVYRIPITYAAPQEAEFKTATVDPTNPSSYIPGDAFVINPSSVRAAGGGSYQNASWTVTLSYAAKNGSATVEEATIAGLMEPVLTSDFLYNRLIPMAVDLNRYGIVGIKLEPTNWEPLAIDIIIIDPVVVEKEVILEFVEQQKEPDSALKEEQGEMLEKIIRLDEAGLEDSHQGKLCTCYRGTRDPDGTVKVKLNDQKDFVRYISNRLGYFHGIEATKNVPILALRDGVTVEEYRAMQQQEIQDRLTNTPVDDLTTEEYFVLVFLIEAREDLEAQRREEAEFLDMPARPVTEDDLWEWFWSQMQMYYDKIVINDEDVIIYPKVALLEEYGIISAGTRVLSSDSGQSGTNDEAENETEDEAEALMALIASDARLQQTMFKPDYMLSTYFLAMNREDLEALHPGLNSINFRNTDGSITALMVDREEALSLLDSGQQADGAFRDMYKAVQAVGAPVVVNMGDGTYISREQYDEEYGGTNPPPFVTIIIFCVGVILAASAVRVVYVRRKRKAAGADE